MDKTLITAGTPFMAELSKRIYEHFSNQAHKYGVKNMIVSCSDEDGEGEHKIFDYARGHDESYVVYGLDADLIMLSLLNMKSKPIYVLLIFFCKSSFVDIAPLVLLVCTYFFNISTVSSVNCCS